MRYFLSDPHFGHYSEETGRGIITFERIQFETIEEHDFYLVRMFTNLSQKVKPNDEVWILGDWGSTDYLWVMDMFLCKTCFVYGNHDTQSNKPKFEEHFDEVYEYPVFLSNKLVVSHIPVAVYDDTINVHGHLHGSVLNSPNHICCSIHVTDYKPIADQYVNSQFGKLPKYNRRFLWEPFADKMRFLQPREDVIMDKDGIIDLAASRVMQKLNKEKKGE